MAYNQSRYEQCKCGHMFMFHNANGHGGKCDCCEECLNFTPISEQAAAPPKAVNWVAVNKELGGSVTYSKLPVNWGVLFKVAEYKDWFYVRKAGETSYEVVGPKQHHVSKFTSTKDHVLTVGNMMSYTVENQEIRGSIVALTLVQPDEWPPDSVVPEAQL